MTAVVAAAGVLDAHAALAWFVVVGNGVAGMWALGANWLPRWRVRGLWWLTIAVELAIAVEVAVGVGLLAGEDLDVSGLHVFYGFIALASVGIIYSYRSQLARYRFLLYGLGGLFLMGLGIRAMVLAHGRG